MSYENIKLPKTIITLFLPRLQSNDSTTTVAGSTRITESLNTRVTRGGNTRVTRDFTITTRPELAVIKLVRAVINLLVPTVKNRK